MSSSMRPAQPGDPSQVARYRVIGRLGSGGMGTVHAALAPDGTRVALKIVHAAYAEDEEFRARFRREVDLSRRVTGPCLVPLLDADPEAATPWLATEYVPGPSLEQHIAAHGPMTGASLYALATGTAAALAAVHEAGVIHRDVKPANVILTDAGPRVLDFGIAHALDGTAVTRTGVMTGTPGWISPEQYRTGSSGSAGDVFAWGALVTYAATGRLPFGGGAPDVVAFRVMSGDPDLDGMPADLLSLVEKALTKDPDERPTAATLADRCTTLLASQATHVLVQQAESPPTLVPDLVAAHWDMPTLDDPAWTLAERHRSRRRLSLLAVAGVTTFALASAGAYAALSPHTAAVSNSAASTRTGTTAPHTNSTAQSSASSVGTVAPTSATTAEVTSLPASSSTLAGNTARPAYTVTDESQPDISDWAAARDASTEAEQAVSREITTKTEHELSQWGPETNVYVTFNNAKQTVYVTSNITPNWSDTDVASYTRTAHAYACLVLAQRLRDEPTTWPYGRFIIVWHKDTADPLIQDFGEATSTQACGI